MSLRNRRAIWLFAAVSLVALAGCGPAQTPPASPAPPTTSPAAPSEAAPAPSPAGELVILCGTSFRPPTEKLVEIYKQETGQTAVLSFGGSEELLPQANVN